MIPATVGRVALAMYRETVRDRVLYALVAFAALVIGASLLISQLTAGQDVKIIKDLGLAAMSMIGVFIAIFIDPRLAQVQNELKRRYKERALTSLSGGDGSGLRAADPPFLHRFKLMPLILQFRRQE